MTETAHSNENAHPLSNWKFCYLCGSELRVKDNSAKQCINETDCKTLFFKNPSPSISAFITDKEGRLLLGERAREPRKGQMGVIGGFIDIGQDQKGETSNVALRREVFEETGLELEGWQHFCDETNVYQFGKRVEITNDTYCLAKAVNIGEMKPNSEISNHVWLHPEEIDFSKFAFESAKKAVSKWVEYRKNLATLQDLFPAVHEDALTRLIVTEQRNLGESNNTHAALPVNNNVVENVAETLAMIAGAVPYSTLKKHAR